MNDNSFSYYECKETLFTSSIDDIGLEEDIDDVDLDFTFEKKINFPSACKPFLWRMSSKTINALDKQFHYILRDNEDEISLFNLSLSFIENNKHNFENEGEIYLFFMFEYVFRKIGTLSFFQKFRAVKLNLEELESISASNKDFYESLEHIDISKKQNYEGCAEHWEMKFNPPDICNNNDIQLILLKATKYCPEYSIQDEQNFIQNIFIKTKHYQER